MAETALATSVKMTPRWPAGTNAAIGFGLALLVASKVVIFGLGGVIARAIGLHPAAVYGGSAAAFLSLFIAAIATIALVFMAGMRRVGRTTFREAGWAPFHARDLAFGGIGFLASIALIWTTAILEGISAQLTRTIWSFSGEQRLFFVFLGVFAAFTEETIFRGVLQPALQRKTSRWVGLILTAVIFAIIHLRFRPGPLVNLFTMGVIFGVLRDQTCRLWAPAIAHALVWAVMGSA